MGGRTGRVKRGENDPNPITASEIACFAYCPEQWRLEYGLKLLPAIVIWLAAMFTTVL